MKKGFTLVELLMVVAIIGVLSTIVTTAAVYSVQSSREKRTEAMRVALEAAITTYHAQDADEKWPGALENYADGAETAVLGESEAQEVFRQIVRKSLGAAGMRNPLIDANALFVAPGGIADGKGSGAPFADALKGGPHRAKIGVSQMVFGYQGKKTGRFHRFSLIYLAETDSVRVSTCCKECCGPHGCTKNGSPGKPRCQICHVGEE